MSYDPDRERHRIIEELSSEPIIQLDKNQIFNLAIQFANEQLDEFAMRSSEFIRSVSHLDIYKHLICEKLETGLNKMIDNARDFIDRNYSKEEISVMSQKDFIEVEAAQRKRFDLLSLIAKKHFK